MFPKKLVAMELVIWVSAVLVFTFFVPKVSTAQESELFSAPVETVRPIPPEGRSVLYLLYTLSETFQFDLKVQPGISLQDLDDYQFRGKIEDLPLRLAIEKILRDSGVTGVVPQFRGETLILSGSLPSGQVQPVRPRMVEKPVDPAAPTETTESAPAEVPVNRTFTQTKRQGEARPPYAPQPMRIADAITSPNPTPSPNLPRSASPWPATLNHNGYGLPTSPAVLNLDSNSPGYSPVQYYNAGYGHRSGYSPYSSGYYGGYYNPYLTAEWCANFPANRLCTHGQIKIDGPELSQVDMYLTPLDSRGLALGPRSNLGPVSKHNSVFNKGYYVPAGMYRVEFINKGESLLLFEDTIRIEPSYVNNGHPQVFKVDKKRFQYEPFSTEITRGEPRRVTIDEWKR